MAEKLFSDELQAWLGSKAPKTLASLDDTFGEKVFAIIFLLLMFLPATPLPTGGITHVFEAIAALLALELIIGRRTIWLPKRFKKVRLTVLAHKKTANFIVKRVKWFEKFARPRMSELMRSRLFRPFFGLMVIIFTFAAFSAPPFSGLDTIPALGVVIISLGVIFEDAALFIAGIVVGIAGIAVEATLGATLVHFIKNLF